MSRDGPATPEHSPAMATANTAEAEPSSPLASSTKHTASATSDSSTINSVRGVLDTRNPPNPMPTATASMYEDKAEPASTLSTQHKAQRIGIVKFLVTENAIDVKVKNRKAPHNAGCTNRVWRVCPTLCRDRSSTRSAAAAVAGAFGPSSASTDVGAACFKASDSRRPDSMSRPSQVANSTRPPSTDAATAAPRQSVSWMKVAMYRGASAQPRFPVRPWALKACPSRVGLTLSFRMEKSTG